MPCDTITNITLSLKNADLNILKKVVTAQGYAVYSENKNGIRWSTGEYNRSTGEIVVRDETIGNRIKKAYSVELAKQTVTRFGWKVRAISDNKFQIQKGY